ncbi:MAG: hypothetical protein LC623_08500 [Halobacteriales archaeon]|nr:hypothetical protein [Halobacteriales archaeon]
MPLNKTLTVKQRRIDVYLPTLEAKARWKHEADKRGQKVSEWVFQVVELSLIQEPEAASPNRVPELEAEVARLGQEVEGLRQRNEELEVLNQRATEDLAQYRAQEFLGGSPVKRLDSRLVKLLSEAQTRQGEPRPVDQPEIVRSLHLKGEPELKALAAQLELLELHEVVRKSTKGWMWNA